MKENESPKEYYLRVWKSIFGELLGWSEEEVLRWAEQKDWLRYLENENDMIYHEPPQYWVVHSLLPEHLQSTLRGIPLVEAHQKLMAALDRNIPHLVWPKEPSWPHLRKNVEQVIIECERNLSKRD